MSDKQKGPDVQYAPIMELLKDPNFIKAEDVKWVEDQLVPYRWYHHRWDWLRLWWVEWREGAQPFTGILCPLLGRHWFKDWRGRIYDFDYWDHKKISICWRCHHCGGSEVVYTKLRKDFE